jgi:hypothetical protein
MRNLRQIRGLVQAFRENHKALKDEGAPEAVIRQEYIDAFWGLLGWDVPNRQHRSLAEKDVVVEANVGTVEGREIRQRRPDYLFRIDGFPRFVVEAKKCAVDIATDKDAIFQAKTYAWSAQIPFAILTNFERFRLFDTTIRPSYHEIEIGLIADFDLKFDDYEQQWDVLEQTFGREAVAAGSLERMLAKIKHVRAGRRIRGIDRMLVDLQGSEPVDKAFLAHLEDFRLRLARELYRENRAAFPEASTRHGAARLAEAAQRIVDRLVFIRVCEDRGVTSYGELRDAVNAARDNRRDLYPELVRLFRKFDERYNGYLFKAHFSEELSIPANPLVDFIRSLYPPDGPYRFDAVGDDILGIIYERFLGSTITVTRGVVEAEPKPEVRHAGGVYYTPKFVVDTIVRRVVGPKIEGKSPLDLLDVKILDPACGSGSFLIAALQYLYTHCLKCFEKDPSSGVVEVTVERGKAKRKVKEKKKLGFTDPEGNWCLMPEFRGEILQSCIYGVDIDAQAVEVTIMSLYLKMLEGRLPEHWQRDMLEARLLPPLDNNIRCGNSLISQTDFDRYWENKFKDLFGGDEDVRFRINAFDWTSQTRGFGRIFEQRKGFDCIIGNPPYIRVQELNKWAPEECEFYKTNYKAAAQGNYDIYVVFVEKGLSLLAPGGLLGLICPRKFWQATYGKGIREIVAKGRYLRSIVDFSDQQVFRGATTYTAIHILGKRGAGDAVDYCRIDKLIDGDAQCRAIDAPRSVNRDDIKKWQAAHPMDGETMWAFLDSKTPAIQAEPSKKRPRLVETVVFSQGFKTGADGVFVVTLLGRSGPETEIESSVSGRRHRIETSLLRPLIKSEHMRRFEITDTVLGLVFPYLVERESWRIRQPDELKAKFPLAWKYLCEMKENLNERERGRFAGELFYQYSRQQNFVPLSKPKLITPDMADRTRFSLDVDGRYVFSGGAAGGVCIIPNEGIDAYYLLGVLNSRLVEHHLRTVNGPGFRGGYLNCEIRFLRDIPIQFPRNAKEDRIGKQIASLSKNLAEHKPKLRSQGLSDRERTQLERELETWEKEIDELVCELYGVKEIPE